MKQKTDYLYIGMDTHKELHTAVIMTYMEDHIGQIEIQNNLKGFQRLLAYVEKCREKQQLKHLTPLYGLEDVTHYGRNLASYLLEQEYTVKEVNSALSFMERMSYPTPKKNDMWDAKCVCSVLMRRYEKLPDADPKDYYWIMKQLVHRRNALVKTKSSLLRQFHEQIQYDYPSYKQFFCEVEGKAAIAFFEQYPSSRALKGTTIEELAVFLRIPSHNVCSTKRAKRILDLVEQDAVKEHNYQFGRDFIIQSMIRNIRFIHDELERIERLQKKLLKEVAYQLETIPGVNTVTACALVGQIGDINRFRNANKLANYAGVAPLCFSSGGKGKNVQNKNQGNRELYAVLYLLAMQQVHVNNKGQARNPLLRAYYESKVLSGKTKIQGLLCIMRRLVNIIFSMMKYQTAYRMPELPEKESSAEKEQMIS